MARIIKFFTLDTSKDILVKLIWGSLDPACHTKPHTHPTLEFSMILSGTGEYQVDNQVYRVAPGDIVLFNNTESHGMWNTGTQPLVNVALEFEPRFIWENLPHLFEPAFLDVFFRRNSRFTHKLDRCNPAFSSIQQQFKDIQTVFEKQLPHGEALVHARLLGILADLLQHYDITTSSSSKPRPPAGMDQVLQYIHQHYNESISLATLADILHINKTYFSQLFRESNGISPKEYIIKMRIADAAQQLKASDIGVLEIAQSCGFNSLSNFYTVFKRITGQSPAQYRANPLD